MNGIYFVFFINISKIKKKNVIPIAKLRIAIKSKNSSRWIRILLKNQKNWLNVRPKETPANPNINDFSLKSSFFRQRDK